MTAKKQTKKQKKKANSSWANNLTNNATNHCAYLTSIENSISAIKSQHCVDLVSK